MLPGRHVNSCCEHETGGIGVIKGWQRWGDAVIENKAWSYTERCKRRGEREESGRHRRVVKSAGERELPGEL